MLKSTYLNAETILAELNKEGLGSDEDWYELLNNLLRDVSESEPCNMYYLVYL